MRGDPLHLCCKGHGLIMFIGPACPFCTALKEIADLKAKLAEYTEAQSSAKAAPPQLGQVAE